MNKKTLTKKEFVQSCIYACQENSFVNTKHSASGLGTPHDRYRSVVCMDNSAMQLYLNSGSFRVEAYENFNPKHSPDLYLMQPDDPAVVPGSGVPKFSAIPTSRCDAFAVCSGIEQGWHVYACSSQEITNLISKGMLKYECILS
jgi:hypothetical protein